MTWQPEIEEQARRKRLAAGLGGEERVARHHVNGKLTLRGRHQSRHGFVVLGF